VDVSGEHTDFERTVEIVGFGGENYRTAPNYGRGEILQVMAKYSDCRKGIKPGVQLFQWISS